MLICKIIIIITFKNWWMIKVSMLKVWQGNQAYLKVDKGDASEVERELSYFFGMASLERVVASRKRVFASRRRVFASRRRVFASRRRVFASLRRVER